MGLQRLIEALYPPQCLLCETRLAEGIGLCPNCRRELDVLSGAQCDLCAEPLPGRAEADLKCDRCLHNPPPWRRGRSAFRYAGRGRDLVLALKWGDRTDIAIPAGHWMAQAAATIVTEDSLIIPVPLYWMRRVKRRYNQAALLGKAMAEVSGADFAAEALRRRYSTRLLDGLNREERSETLAHAIETTDNPQVEGRACVVVDDVLTTGATLSACTKALQNAGAAQVDVVTLARVAFGD